MGFSFSGLARCATWGSQTRRLCFNTSVYLVCVGSRCGQNSHPAIIHCLTAGQHWQGDLMLLT